MDAYSVPEVLSSVSLGPENWDRRRRDTTAKWAAVCLDHAANHLIEDQMRPDRTYWPGAKEAVSLLRKAHLAIKTETILHQQAGRVAASWVPKSTLARQTRDDASEA